MMDADVVVVGAGAAGIGAARVLVEAGRTVVVLEGRERVGGRAFTDTLHGMPFDAGAAYVHFADRNPWVAVARNLGAALEPHEGWDRGSAWRNGQEIPPAERAAYAQGFDRFLDRVHAVTPDADRSLAALASPEDSAAADAARRYGRQAIGEDPERISAADIAASWEGPDLVVPGGYGRLVSAYADGLPVKLGDPVIAIRWDGRGVAVETASGVTVRAGHAVVTVPTGVLAAGRILFTPALPDPTLAAIRDLPMGALTKVALAFDGERFGIPPWRYLRDLDFGFAFGAWHFGRNLVIATIGGDAARELVRAGEEAAVDAALQVFCGIVGEGARLHVTGGELSAWWADPFSEGSYAVVPPGRLAARAALAQPVGGRIYFAGEATAGPACMTVGGALLEGRRAAACILSGLQD
jgi:monoamine oxidase